MRSGRLRQSVRDAVRRVPPASAYPRRIYAFPPVARSRSLSAAPVRRQHRPSAAAGQKAQQAVRRSGSLLYNDCIRFYTDGTTTPQDSAGSCRNPGLRREPNPYTRLRRDRRDRQRCKRSPLIRFGGKSYIAARIFNADYSFQRSGIASWPLARSGSVGNGAAAPRCTSYRHLAVSIIASTCSRYGRSVMSTSPQL